MEWHVVGIFLATCGTAALVDDASVNERFSYAVFPEHLSYDRVDLADIREDELCSVLRHAALTVKGRHGHAVGIDYSLGLCHSYSPFIQKFHQHRGRPASFIHDVGPWIKCDDRTIIRSAFAELQSRHATTMLLQASVPPREIGIL